jgi:neutral ceramidase
MFPRMLLSLLAFALMSGAGRAAEPSYKAGTASRVITPAQSLWMAGYASRTKPAEGKEHDLLVKALALEDADGGRLVLLTSDLIGLPRSLSEFVAAEVLRQAKLPRARLMLTCSHTHCGPVLDDSLTDMYDLPAGQREKIAAYTADLKKKMIEVIVAALADLKPAKLSIGAGMARFAMNRREVTDKGVINGRNPDGPVDHSVPVLRIEAPDGKLRAVVFGYACHNTTMQYLRWCGDYAGFAQQYIEEKHPGALALFWIGCGGDANPLPRGKIELCQKYGRELADAVEGVLKGDPTPLKGAFSARYQTISLPLGALPTREKLTADMLSKQYPVRTRATRLLKELEAKGKIADTYPHYPVQVWRLGDAVLWIALGGEVVIDYNLRLKNELVGDAKIWITGYANDVMAYVPSARVLKEGGYEADSSMIYYGFPTSWAPAIEDQIVAKVKGLAKK